CLIYYHAALYLYHLFSFFYSLLTLFLFFFNDTSTTEIYTLSLHDALPIFRVLNQLTNGFDHPAGQMRNVPLNKLLVRAGDQRGRSEEHTSELQSRGHLVCRLLLEKKKKKKK